MIRRLARAFSSPFRRFFNPRFESVDGRVVEAIDQIMIARQEIVRAETGVFAARDSLKELLVHDMDASTESTKMLASYLNELLVLTEEIRENRPSRAYFERLREGKVEDLDEDLAAVLNYSTGPFGFAAQRGVWFNPPTWVTFARGDARLGGVNERIAEVPYTFRALGPVPAGAAVLDVGSAESTVSLSLASLGYRVTALDPRPQTLAHPNLRTVASGVEEWDTDERFDAIVCLSTIEHLGLGAYYLPVHHDADVAAMRRLRDLARPGALLVLTTPYGKPGVDWLQRTYDRAGLDRLLEGWSVEDLTILRKVDDWTWEVADPGAPVTDQPGVALVTARLSG